MRGFFVFRKSGKRGENQSEYFKRRFILCGPDTGNRQRTGRRKAGADDPERHGEPVQSNGNRSVSK